MERVLASLHGRVINADPSDQSRMTLQKLGHFTAHQIGPDGVISRLRRQQMEGAQKTQSGKMPGSESQWQYRYLGHNVHFNILKKEAVEIVRSMEDADRLVMYQYEYCPRE